MGRGLARGLSLLFINWVCRQGEGNWSHSQNPWAPRSLSNKSVRQMLGPQEWRGSLGGRLLGQLRRVQQHMLPRLCFYCCCCCLVARARAAFLAGVTVPVIHRRGHYMTARCAEPCGDNACLPCPPGTFLARENHSKTDCTRCQVCDEEAFQVTLANCSAVSDTHCGCQAGWFPDCSTEPCGDTSPFSCIPCSDCETTPSRSCPSGFYEHGNGCVSCPTSFSSPCPEACTAVCGWKHIFWVQVLLGAFFLGATLICAYCRWQPCKPVVPADTAETETLTLPQTHHSASDSAHTLLTPADSAEKVCTTIQLVGNSWASGSSPTQEVACHQASQSWDLPSNTTPALPAGSPAALLQPGPQLYYVMDAVPARRWKEFVRTLGLREAEIEAVEVEICRFRDQQYEMLKRWRQQQPAGLGAIYAALERMGLEGCAEDLRSRLQRGP
ncbi:tumor necrosis factor receptor superfamily member 25 isoform X3 [Meriones unguiculatus]|uniref:tumor necrosis factor receptor superfamily member 25 isoform X3 n=1 Tax=Meriones unguiculatus TaxID=10047 RepID=UPI00293EBB76|nr:tumor necrosis factor receptor superfamily member 25 isoform X3 [Meriones unguiculatus]